MKKKSIIHALSLPTPEEGDTRYFQNTACHTKFPTLQVGHALPLSGSKPIPHKVTGAYVIT